MTEQLLGLKKYLNLFSQFMMFKTELHFDYLGSEVGKT